MKKKNNYEEFNNKTFQKLNLFKLIIIMKKLNDKEEIFRKLIINMKKILIITKV